MPHEDYRFSVKVYVDDESRLACLRGLAWHCQKTKNKMTSVSGTGGDEWIINGRNATFYFTEPAYREEFKKEYRRFFPKVKVISESDDIPAPRSKAYSF